MTPTTPAGDKPPNQPPDQVRSSGTTGPSLSHDIFDVRRIRRLAELMNEHELVQLDIQQGQMRIRIRRDVEPSDTGTRARPAPSVASTPAPAAEPAKELERHPTDVAPKEDYIKLIKSPMVGTFYAAPDPDSPAYVKVGDVVGPETVVCIVEAMKVFNEIPAEVSGKIAAVLVENGAPVEYGQPLFKVEPIA